MRDFLFLIVVMFVIFVIAMAFIAGVVALCVWLFPFIGFWSVVLGVLLLGGVSCSITATRSRS